MNLKRLREAWGALIDKAEAIRKQATAETRDMTPEEQEQFDAICLEADGLEERIEREEKQERRLARMKELADAREQHKAKATPAEQNRREAFGHYLRTGEVQQRGLTVADDKTGGYLAPIDFVQEIIENEVEYCPFRGIARVRPTSRRSVQVPKKTASFAAAWIGETGTRAETTGLTFGLEEIPTHEMYARVLISQQDLDDTAFDLEAYVQAEMAEQFAVAEATAYITGDGVAKPLGFTVSGPTMVESSTQATFTGDDLIDLLYGLKVGYWRNATWLFNRTTLRAIRKLKANNEYIWSPMGPPNQIATGLPGTILDRPFLLAPEMANTGTAANKSVAVGDFRRGYLVVDRLGMSLLRDPYSSASTGNIILHGRRRVGGQVVQGEAIRVMYEKS